MPWTGTLRGGKPSWDSRVRAGAEVLTICPEFGPPDYQVTFPGTRRPLVDLWEINRAMSRDILKERLGV